MIKTTIALVFLVALTSATFSINLEANDLKEIISTVKPPVAPATVGTPAGMVIFEKIDKVYTFSPKINDVATKVVFDSTVGVNWEWEK